MTMVNEQFLSTRNCSHYQVKQIRNRPISCVDFIFYIIIVPIMLSSLYLLEIRVWFLKKAILCIQQTASKYIRRSIAMLYHTSTLEGVPRSQIIYCCMFSTIAYLKLCGDDFFMIGSKPVHHRTITNIYIASDIDVGLTLLVCMGWP